MSGKTDFTSEHPQLSRYGNSGYFLSLNLIFLPFRVREQTFGATVKTPHLYFLFASINDINPLAVPLSDINELSKINYVKFYEFFSQIHFIVHLN